MAAFASHKAIEAETCILEHLDLSKNKISDFTGEKIAQFLKRNKCVKHLNLSDNLLKEATGERFEQILDVNKTLTFLNLELNSIRQKALEKIAMKMKANKGNRLHRSVVESDITIQYLKSK